MSIYSFQETPARGPWSSPDPQPEERDPAREPMFNAPWPALVLVGAILAGYAVQSRLPEYFLNAYVFSPAALARGQWWTLITSIFLHGNWLHALSNAGFVLAFGTPVARLFGLRARGVLLYFGFYLVCGVFAALGFAAAHPHGTEAMVGASGAASGLVAAASRLVAGRGRLGPMVAPFVVTMGLAWLAVNLLVAGVMAAGATALLPGTGGAGIAWEAHLAGFLAGLVLVGPFARLAQRA